jgi:hypothetical protein
LRRTWWLRSARRLRDRRAVKPLLQTLDQFQQCLLLLLHLAQLFSNSGVLGLHGRNIALQVAWSGSLSNDSFIRSA